MPRKRGAEDESRFHDPVVLLGCALDNLDFAGAVQEMTRLAQETEPRYVVTPNVDHLIMRRKDREFATAYAGAALRLADGMPLLWAASLQRTPLRSKNSGSDLLPALCESAAEHGLRVFFFGGRPGACERAAEQLRARHPRLQVVGVHCPPLRFEEDEESHARAREAVRSARPDLLFVALSAPRQEIWMHRNAHELGVPLSIGVGASVDFVAGLQRRAPRWMQRTGLEWLYRLIREPRRMAGRYLVRDLPFLWFLLRLMFARITGRGSAESTP